MSAAVDVLLARLADAERRLVELADAPIPPGLTDPDPGADERWEAGQVWAHLAEFPDYWLNEARRVVADGGGDPVPFGRIKTDPGRVAAIERDRHADPAALLERVRASLARVSDEVRSYSPQAWQAHGTHPTRGTMTVERLVEEFIVGHLEEHADQLEALRGVRRG